ncbi:MAG: transposase [Gammaproteobacteria bacterium]|nr:transposase [Gammaproteobacteria bacterium]
MATFRRSLTPGGTYFFTVNTYRRQRTLTEPRSLPAGDMNYSLRWNLIKRQVSQAVRDCLVGSVTESRVKRRELGLWQRRFWEHQIRDDGDFMRHVDYIHFNPVKHGYVQRVMDWPYSSFHSHVKQGLCPIDWAGGGDDGEVYGERADSD